MAFGAERSVAVKLKANVTDYVGKVKVAGKATADFAHDTERNMVKHKAAWQGVGNVAMVAGLAIGAAVIGAVKAYADFDKAMSGVAAVADASAKEQSQLADAAIKAGQATVFSASQAAEAEAELAKAGVAVKDILGGGLVGAMNLAAAGQIGLGDAAVIAAQAMNTFELKGKDVSHIADVLTAGANKSAAGVSDLGLAMSQSGTVASQMGLSLEETVGALSAFADSGIRGSDAGTSLKTMLQRLANPTGKAAQTLTDLGISAYDAQGNFVGLESLAGQLQTSMGGLTVQQRNAALSIVFGSDAIRAASILYKEGASGIADYTNAVNDNGAAARMAGRQLDNLAGDFEQLKGSLETAFITAGKGGNAPLRTLTQDLTGLVNKFAELSPETQAAIFKIAALTAGTLLLGGAAIKAATAMATFRASMAAADMSAVKLTGRIRGVAAAAVALTAMNVAGDQMLKVWTNVAGATDDQTRSLEAYIKAGTDAENVTLHMKDGFDNLGNAVNQALNPNLWTSVTAFFDKLGRAGGLFGETKREQANAFFADLDKGLTGLVSSGKGDQAAEVFKKIAAEAKSQGYTLDQVKAKFPQYAAALDTASVATDSAAAKTGALTETLQAVTDDTEKAKQQTDDYIQSLLDLGSTFLGLRGSQRGFKQAIADASKALKDNGQTLNINTQKGRDNAAALDAVGSSALDLADNIYKQTGSEEAMRRSLIQSRASLVRTAEKFGMSKKAAQEYADSILNIPPKVDTTISLRIQGLADLKTAAAYFQSMKDKHVTLTVGTIKVGNTKVNAGQFAEGGYISGPGTPTSDSIPSLLSDGEYVVKAAAVAKYGATFFDSVNAMRFASGGPVMAAMASRGAPAASAASLTGLSIEGTLDLGNGLTGYVRGIIRDTAHAASRSR